MIFSRRHVLAALVLLHPTAAFQLPVNKPNTVVSSLPKTTKATFCLNSHSSSNDNHHHHEEEEAAPTEKENRRTNVMRRLVSKLKKPVAFLTAPLLIASSMSAIIMVGAPESAQASAPVMAMPKADVRDPGTDAIELHQIKMRKVAQEDLKQFTVKARQIEAQEGEAARAKFESDYKANQERLAKERLERIDKLYHHLLDEGIDPFIDIEGQRQVIEAELGVDLGTVAGTPFYVEKRYEEKTPQKSFGYRKQASRAVVKCMVEDMKNRGIDPVQYFKTHQDKTISIFELPADQAVSLAQKYRANLDEFGQISPPAEGEMSAKEKMAKSGSSSASKDETKRLKAEAKAVAAAEKASAKAKAKEEKEIAKAEAKAAKEATKKANEAAKVAVAAAAVAASAAAASGTTAAAAAGSVAASAADAVEGATQTIVESVTTADSDASGAAAVATTDEASSSAVQSKKSKKGLPIVPAAAVVVAIGGGAYAFKMMQDKSATDEEERQRQFKLLMGGLEKDASPSPAPALEEVDASFSDTIFEFEDEKTQEEDSVPKAADKALKKKKKRGFFGGKKSAREVDISSLVGAEGKAPDFAKLLAKILTYGAPGRFPGVIAFSGEMPMQEFELEAASKMLTEAQETATLSKEEAAEVFANVVNCMLIDIVDLASSSLKEKDTKLTVEALSIVVDYMNHAASLYNSIAEGVVITPVTYGGDLSKSKLEQMYSAYAVSGMTNMASMDEDFENRVSLLQDVFQINEKKAEGLMMKAMQANMMEMMKSGEGMEGMEEMMKGMGDTGGMGGMGMPGMEGEEPSPEQLKEMLKALKELKDSGSIPPSELEEVKKQFREAFGSSIDDVMQDADKNEGELGSQDKELLDLMKSILD